MLLKFLEKLLKQANPRGKDEGEHFFSKILEVLANPNTQNMLGNILGVNKHKLFLL